jgi:hypothetical protein
VSFGEVIKIKYAKALMNNKQGVFKYSMDGYSYNEHIFHIPSTR